jgi:uncharacterized membrane protein
MVVWTLWNGGRSYLQKGILGLQSLWKEIPCLRISGDNMIENQCCKEDRSDQSWLKWMKFGEKTGCHQRPDRSFFIKGYQMPVCARCTGVILGYLIAVPTFFLFGFSKLFSIGGSAVLLVDWLLQAMGVRKSTNKRRLISGALGGYGIMSLQLFIIKKVVELISHYFKLLISK